MRVGRAGLVQRALRLLTLPRRRRQSRREQRRVRARESVLEEHLRLPVRALGDQHQREKQNDERPAGYTREQQRPTLCVSSASPEPECPRMRAPVVTYRLGHRRHSGPGVRSVLRAPPRTDRRAARPVPGWGLAARAAPSSE